VTAANPAKVKGIASASKVAGLVAATTMEI
jgi:hypothetical protein